VDEPELARHSFEKTKNIVNNYAIAWGFTT